MNSRFAFVFGAVALIAPLVSRGQSALPPLGISRSAGNVTLQWPVAATDWKLALAGDLAAPDWLGTTTEPTVSGGQNSLSRPISGSHEFYQLRHRGAVVPFTTYEAEAAGNTTTGTVVTMTVLPTSTTSTPELEAAGRAYVALSNAGERLDFPNIRAANTIVLRHCIPDAPTGGGITATLSLYVNGVFRQTLTLSSRHNWLYGHAPNTGTNGQSNDPAAGTAHVFWDETRAFITGGVQVRKLADCRPAVLARMIEGAKVADDLTRRFLEYLR